MKKLHLLSVVIGFGLITGVSTVKGLDKGASLFKAVQAQDLAAAKTLLEKDKVNPNVVDSQGYSALVCACHMTEQVPMVKLLLTHGADANIRDSIGVTPLMQACSSAGTPIEIIKLLLKHGANPRLEDSRGDDSFAWATNANFDEALRVLESFKKK